MFGFWSNPDKFSIKDLLAITYSAMFGCLCLSAVVIKDKSTRETILSILPYLSNIQITVLGGYAITEGAKGISKSYNDNNNSVG